MYTLVIFLFLLYTDKNVQLLGGISLIYRQREDNINIIPYFTETKVSLPDFK